MDQRELGRSEGRVEGESIGKILGSVETMREFNIPEDPIKQKIIKRYNLTQDKANLYLSESTVKYNS